MLITFAEVLSRNAKDITNPSVSVYCENVLLEYVHMDEIRG